MKKSLLVFFVILTMCSSLCNFAYADNSAPIYEYSSVKFGYVEDNVWRDAFILEPGKDLSARMTVENKGGNGELIFALLLYNDDAIEKVDVSAKEVKKGKTEFTLSLALPSDVSDCYVTTVLTDSVSKMNFVSPGGIFPGGSCDLVNLSVNGNPVENFRYDIYEYSVNIPYDTKTPPVITYLAEDGSATVNVEKPELFPGKSVITVSKPGMESKTYTVEYKSMAVENARHGADAIMAESTEGATPKLENALINGAPCWTDRDSAAMVFTNVSDEVRGLPYIRGALNWQNGGGNTYWTYYNSTELLTDWYEFDIKRSSNVMILLSGSGLKTEKFASEYGWTLSTKTTSTGYLQAYAGSVRTYNKMLTKYFEVPDGEVLTVKIPNLSDGYVPITVIQSGSYDPDPIDKATMLKELNIDGKPVALINNVYDYTVEIPANQEEFPVVEAVAEGEEAIVSANAITEKFPGKTLVTVTMDGAETREYTINYTAKAVENLKANDKAVKNEAGETRLSVQLRNNLQVGVSCWEDRLSNANMTMKAVDSSLAGEDYIIGNLVWSQETLFEPISSYWAARKEGYTEEFIEDWVSFELKRSAHIRVIYGNNDMHKADHLAYFAKKGYEETTNASGYLRPYVTSEQIYTKMLSRHYTVDGNEGVFVNIPNLGATRSYACYSYVIVIDYDDYGEKFDDPVIEPEPEPEPEPVVPGTELKNLTVDGTSIALESGVYSYEFEIPAYQNTVPVVEAEASDALATVEETETPSKFPGKSVITVTKEGEETKTYTINYTAVLTENVKANDKAVKDEEGNVVRSVQLRNNLQVGVPCWNDRLTNANMTMKAVDSSLAGEDYIIGNLVWSQEVLSEPISSYWAARTEGYTNSFVEDWVSFDLKRSAHVKIIYANNDWYKADHLAYFARKGYSEYTNNYGFLKSYVTSEITYTKMLSRHYTVCGDAPVKVKIPNLGATRSYGCYSYVIVIDYDEYGETFDDPEELPEPVIVPTELSSLTVDGTEITLTDGVYEYDVTIPANQMWVPVVEGIANNPEATVTQVQSPNKFPGTSVIEVTLAGEETTIYTINYKAEAVTNLKANDLAVTNSSGNQTLSVVLRNNLQNGVPCWNDRLTNAHMVMSDISENLIGEDYIIGNLGWSAESPTQPMSSYWNAKAEGYTDTPISDWISFDLNRSATVKIFYNNPVYVPDTHSAAFLNAGYTNEINNSGYLKALVYANSPFPYVGLYSQHFDVNDEAVKVEIPNLGNTRSYAGYSYIIVIDYDEYN